MWHPTKEPDGHIAGVGDFDGDGRDDFLWANSTNFDTQLNAADDIIPPTFDELWDQALTNVSQFLDGLMNQVEMASSSPGADQGSYYEDYSDWAPMDDPFYLDMFGWMPSVQNDPSVHFFDYLSRDVDPEFVLASMGTDGFSATIGGNFGSMSAEPGLVNAYTFEQGGMLMRGVWHPFETNPDPTDKNAIVITGVNVGYWTFEPIGFCGFNPSAQYSASNNGGGGGSAPIANATPCVETNFTTSGVSIAGANNAALDASNKIAALDDENYEYSSIVYSLNGVTWHTDPYTDHLDDRVNWVGNLNQVPDGAVILGIVHSHPDISGITDTIPSGAGSEEGIDWIQYKAIVNWNQTHDTAHDFPRGITVDPNMLLWLYSNEDHKTHVYDNTDKSDTSPSCTLQ
jgi:hypothetical protein